MNLIPITINLIILLISSPEASKDSAPAPSNSSYESQFIDLLSLNLDRSKTWVEMTEAKLNYMIGETDAVLRTMCFDSSDDEAKTETSRATKTKTIQQESKNTSEEVYHHHHHHHHFHSPACLNCSRSSVSPQPSPLPPTCSAKPPIPNTNETSNIEELTKVYLDNYKRQLEDSRKELSTKMSMLEKEREKVSKIRDIRKREQYMRRQAAIEAFKLERERELNAPISKINELKSLAKACEIEEEYSSFNRSSNQENECYYDELNGSISGRGRARKRYTQDPQLPSYNREKLAKLRRNVVLNSSNHNINLTMSSDMFKDEDLTSTNNNMQSFDNTPRSGMSLSSADPQSSRYSSRLTTKLDKDVNGRARTSTSRTEAAYSSNLNNTSSRLASTLLTSTTTTTTTTIAHNPALALTSSPISSSFVYNRSSAAAIVPPLTLSSYDNHKSYYGGESGVSNSPPNPVMLMIPVKNRSFSSTPRTTNYLIESNGNESSRSAARRSYNTEGFENNSSDTRLLIPVQEKQRSAGLNSCSSSNSIIDESKSLLREYEQLRSDSVSEIQRAHDSLNASLVWLENQKLK